MINVKIFESNNEKKRDDDINMNNHNNFMKNNLLKKILTCVLGISVIAGVGTGVSSLVRRAKQEKKEISLTWDVGAISNTSGEYIENKQSLYTKDSFECYGLEIDLDFDNDIRYQVYYYDDFDKYLECSDIKSERHEELDVPLEATYAKIVIYPKWTNVEEKKQEVKWTNKRSFGKQLSVKVAKEQMNEIKTFKLCSCEDVIYTFKEKYTWNDLLENNLIDNSCGHNDFKNYTIVDEYICLNDFFDSYLSINNNPVKITDHVKSGTYDVIKFHPNN